MPQDARPAFGVREVSVSLNTTSRCDAMRLEKRHDADFQERLAAARSANDPEAVATRIKADIRLNNGGTTIRGLFGIWKRVLRSPLASDDDRAAAHQMIINHAHDVLERSVALRELAREIGDLLSALPNDQIAQCREMMFAVLRQTVGAPLAQPRPEGAPPVAPPTATDPVHTLDWAFDRWKRAKDGDRAPSTVNLAERHFNGFKAHAKLALLDQVKRSHLLAWRDSLVEGGKHKPKSINQRLQLTMAILRAGWRDAEMTEPNLTALTLPEPDDSGRRAWSRDEILTALRGLKPGSWQAWIFLIGLTTGTRLGEPVAAQKDWLSASGFIELRDRRMAKADKEHAMPIIACLREPLARYAATRPAGFLFNAPKPADPDVPISNVASMSMNRLFDKLGIDRVFHELRDTWIEAARHSPIKRELWEIISGHSGLAVSDRYGGETPELLLAANETINEWLTGDSEIMAEIRWLIA